MVLESCAGQLGMSFAKCVSATNLHIVVKNGGIVGQSDLVSPDWTRLSDWRRIFAVNVASVFFGCRPAIRALRASSGGSIINISSVAGLSATPSAIATVHRIGGAALCSRAVAHPLHFRTSARCAHTDVGQARREGRESSRHRHLGVGHITGAGFMHTFRLCGSKTDHE